MSCLSRGKKCPLRISYNKRVSPIVHNLIIFTVCLTLVLSITSTQAEQYISDRLCARISSKVNQSISQSQQQQQVPLTSSLVNYYESHHLAYLNYSDGAKHPFWVQCTIEDNPLSNGFGVNSSLLANKLRPSSDENEQLPLSSTDKLDHLGSIIDWTLGGAPPSADESATFFDESPGLKGTPPIQDDRYDYLLSVSSHCRRQLTRQCASFKIGLLGDSYQGHSSVSECPACGLNDQNCENVNQCTSKCGQIKSINYPQNYGNNHRCRWSIRAPDGFYVNLSVLDFDIPSANNATKLGTCIFDYLTLIDGYTGKRIGCYCNEHLPPANIVSPWNELIIQFDTNSETTGRGFYFSYEFMRIELNERIRSQLLVSSGTRTEPLSAGSPAVSMAQNQTSSPASLCLHGWQYFRGSCYRAYNGAEPLQWYDAENSCNSFGEGLDGHLVSILDREEMLVILYWLTNVWNSTRYREYYIGLIDVSREGLYRWSDNNPMSYTDWELKPMLLEDETPAQPDGGAYEDCTVIRYSSFSRTSNWHDVPCSLGKHYHSHLEKSHQINFKWDYVSSFICKSDSISLASASISMRSKKRRPLFSNEFKPAPISDSLASHLTGASSNNLAGNNQQQQVVASATTRENSYHNGWTLQSLASNQTSSARSTAATTTTSSHKSQHSHLSKLDDNRYFVCDNLEVISTVLRCDGIAHCRDGSDESNGCNQECLDWQFRCANGRCISIGYYCDFNDNCGDGSDESRCERHRCKLNEFRCQSGQCIPAQQRCDLLPDCSDSSDEGRSCTIGSNCNSASTFQCYNGLCIPKYAVCDFQIDCPGKFHEDEDASTCELLQKQATSSNQQNADTAFTAIFPSASTPKQALAKQHQQQQVVFYPADHAHSVDHLPSNLFRCKSGNTIDTSQRCLFEFDKYGYQLGCRDVSHLIDCEQFECPVRDYVKCPNSYCVPWRYVCDGKWDCIMGDDEVGCARYVCPGQYKCANQSSCILLHQLCDGHRQCPMGDDEWFCDLQCPLGCDCIGQSVNCRGANLTHLASNYISRSVRKLDLSYNKLGPNLSQSNFDSYHDLGELILSHNEIEVLIPRKFHQLRNLYKLDLSYNQIHSVKRGAFAGLRRVTQLLLESNQQLFLLEPEAFLGLSSLQMLNISSSRIQSLRKNTFDGLTSLRHLLLRSNMILAVEDGAFRSLTSLVSLDMRGNDIKHFTKSVFSDLKSLRNLSTDSFKFCCLMNHQIPADKCLPLPDEISDCEDLLSSVPQRTCIWIAGAMACVGNLIVIVWRYRDRLGEKEREVEQIDSTLLLSLACSDLLMGIYLIIIALVDGWYRGRYIENADKWRESPLCNLCGFLSTVSSTVSVLSLVFMAHSRFSNTCWPLKMPNKITLGRTHRLIQVSWLMALTVATVPLLVWPYFKGQFYARSGVCLAFHITDQRAAGWLYSILVSPCFNLIAFLYIFKCYTRIYLEISKAKLTKTMTKWTRTMSKTRVLLIVLVHFVAFSPPIIIGFISLAGYTPPAALYSWIAVLVLPVNSAINPMIYTMPDIRKTIKKVIINYRARKSGGIRLNSVSLQGFTGGQAPPTTVASSATNANGSEQTVALSSSSNQTTKQQQQQQNQLREFSLLSAQQTDASKLMHFKRRLSRRNVPPGYWPLREYIGQRAQANAELLVQIALEIARDVEQKHKDGKVYTSLGLDEVFVSDSVQQVQLARGSQEALPEHNKRVAVFLADHDGYRQKNSQPCSHMLATTSQTGTNIKNDIASQQIVATRSSVGSHFHRSHHSHKTSLNCECHDVVRFGDILIKLIQLYNTKRLDNSIKSANLQT